MCVCTVTNWGCLWAGEGWQWSVLVHRHSGSTVSHCVRLLADDLATRCPRRRHADRRHQHRRPGTQDSIHHTQWLAAVTAVTLIDRRPGTQYSIHHTRWLAAVTGVTLIDQRPGMQDYSSHTVIGCSYCCDTDRLTARYAGQYSPHTVIGCSYWCDTDRSTARYAGLFTTHGDWLQLLLWHW